jgi:hypothetical protein
MEDLRKKRTMRKAFKFLSLMAVIFSLAACKDGGDPSPPPDTWINVTSFSQVNGSWKTSSSYSYTTEDLTYSFTYNNYIVTFVAPAKTMTASGSATVTFSGKNINELWPSIKSGYTQSFNEMPGTTVTFDDTNHSYTATYNNYSQAFTDEALSLMGMQINQNRSKLKMVSGSGVEIIYTKL